MIWFDAPDALRAFKMVWRPKNGDLFSMAMTAENKRPSGEMNVFDPGSALSKNPSEASHGPGYIANGNPPLQLEQLVTS
ncbi:MAG: hypothetical protein Q8P59_01025 [Dehalococcoidia bacterium]|nr:hypothetical protein [Dehalococcoidia bacterium]